MKGTLILSAALLFVVGCGETVIKEGRWRITRFRPLIPESGARPQQLVRTGRGRVAEHIALARIYAAEDCVIFVGRSSRAMWSFVCGDRPPRRLVPYTGLDGWFPDENGLSRWMQIEVTDESTALAKETYRVADLAHGDTRVSKVLSPVRGEMVNPATREPAWMFALRAHDCEALRAMPGVPTHRVAPYDPPILEGVRAGDICAVEVLIRRGADVGAGGSDGDTALMEAVNQRNREMVRLLLPYANDVEKAAARGRAQAMGQPEILELFTH